MKNWFITALFACHALAANAACPSWPTAQRFVINGAEVTDTRTGLVWARCSVGQSWSGTACTGSASTFAHEAALQYAATQTGWRVPSRRELSSLADKGCLNPAIDSAAFPSTPSVAYWSSSPIASTNGGSSWSVNFTNGLVTFGSRYTSNIAVRLVRTSQ